MIKSYFILHRLARWRHRQWFESLLTQHKQGSARISRLNSKKNSNQRILFRHRIHRRIDSIDERHSPPHSRNQSAIEGVSKQFAESKVMEAMNVCWCLHRLSLHGDVMPVCVLSVWYACVSAHKYAYTSAIVCVRLALLSMEFRASCSCDLKLNCVQANVIQVNISFSN